MPSVFRRNGSFTCDCAPGCSARLAVATQDVDEAAPILQCGIVQVWPALLVVRVLVNGVQALRVYRRRPTDGPVCLVPPFPTGIPPSRNRPAA